jgi:competence protein ComEC
MGIDVVDPTLVLGLALLAGGLAAVCPWPTSAAVAATLVLARRRASAPVLVFGLCAVALNAVRAGRAVARFDRARTEVRDALGGPARCAARGTVKSSPVSFRSASRSPPALVPSFDAELEHVECDGRALASSFRARLYGGPGDLARGDEIEVVATLAPAQLLRNEDLSDPRPGAARRGVLASGGAEDIRVTRRARGLLSAVDRFRASSRDRIEATFAPLAAPMARALVIGESDLDDDDNQAFRASGLAHILAVSGTHLVLVVAGAVRMLVGIMRRVAWASERWDVGRLGAACGAAFAWIYADFAGGSGSAVRAAAMLSVALAARALGRPSNGPRAFGLSLVGASLVDPLVGFDFSFLLSVAATGGLMVLQRPLALRLAPAPLASSSPPTAIRRAWRATAGALATTMSATIGCAPLIAFIAPSLPIGGILANLLAVPVGELVALPLCLGHTLLGFAPLLERGAALVASGSLLVVRAIARGTAHVTWLALPVPPPSAWQSALVWCASVALLFGDARRRIGVGFAAASLLVASELLARRRAAPQGELRVTVLDVGQGDASVVDLPDGRAMLVDGGGLVGSPIDVGKAVLAPVLRARRRTSLAVVVLSHPHPDHFGGLASAIADVDVGEFWDTGQGEREGAGPAYAALLASLRARGVPILRPSSLCGRPRSFGGAKVEVLAPCPEPVAFANPNDNSFVIRVTYGQRAALLVGDAERAEEEELVRHERASLRADFLKVGHHGSATSSTASFVAAVGAVDTAISCGVRNRFGHPHPKTLRTLSASCRVHRTDRVGSIRWDTDGVAVALVEATEGDFHFW